MPSTATPKCEAGHQTASHQVFSSAVPRGFVTFQVYRLQELLAQVKDLTISYGI